MAACTSRAAASILRFRSNCSVMLVLPSWLVETIWVTLAICPNCRSRGVATAEAIVSGLAPGKFAYTLRGGKPTGGGGATGRTRNATPPASRIASEMREVATGRRMNGAEKLEAKFTGDLSSRERAVEHLF